jgi:hypothetical protein
LKRDDDFQFGDEIRGHAFGVSLEIDTRQPPPAQIAELLARINKTHERIQVRLRLIEITVALITEQGGKGETS